MTALERAFTIFPAVTIFASVCVGDEEGDLDPPTPEK